MVGDLALKLFTLILCRRTPEHTAAIAICRGNYFTRSTKGLQEGHLIVMAITPRIWDKEIASRGHCHHLPASLPALPEAAQHPFGAPAGLDRCMERPQSPEETSTGTSLGLVLEKRLSKLLGLDCQQHKQVSTQSTANTSGTVRIMLL